MIVLIDTNVIVTYLLQRDVPDLVECRTILQHCATGRLKGYVNLPTLATAWYLMRKMDVSRRREKLRELCRVVNLANIEMVFVRQAIDNDDFPDFEDNLQECCAQSVGADYIVTANVKDFSGHSRVVPITPAGLLGILEFQAFHQNPSAPEIHEEVAPFFPHGILVTEQIRLSNHIISHRHRWQGV